MVLMELAREEESQFKIYGSGWRRKRFEVLDRFIVLFESGRPTIYPALLSVAKHLKGRK
jgi:hypothetical protein